MSGTDERPDRGVRAGRALVAGLRTRLQADFDVAGLTAEIGREHFYPPVRLAVDAFPGPQP